MNRQLDPQFAQGVELNLRFWRAFLEAQPDSITFSLEHSNLVQAVRYGLLLPAYGRC